MLGWEPMAVASSLQPRCAVDGKYCVVNEMFLAEFQEEYLGHRCVLVNNKRMRQAVRLRTDGGVQPILLVVEMNHGFVDRYLIQIRTVERL